MVTSWKDGQVTYEGDVVSFGGSSLQALKDTAQRPGGNDWIVIATAGKDARSMRMRGTYSTDETYECLDVVTKDSCSFAALRDIPGPCPGKDWQMVACGGKRGPIGDKGERGINGIKGEQGEPGKDGKNGKDGKEGIRFASWKVDRKNYRAIAVMSDGSEQVLELRPMFEQFNVEAR
jgi:hypothetical protein